MINNVTKSLLLALVCCCSCFSGHAQGELWGVMPKDYQGDAEDFTGEGVIFMYNLNSGKYKVKHRFKDATGDLPTGHLTRANNGKFYGTTREGGTGDGVLFEFDPLTNAYKDIIRFQNSTGRTPYGMTLGRNGKLYGMTSSGGTYGHGVIFEFDPSTYNYTIKYSFNRPVSGWPKDNVLMQEAGTSNFLYGVTYYGGISDHGVFFKFNYETTQFTKIKDFANTTFGTFPQGKLSQQGGKIYGVSCGKYSVIDDHNVHGPASIFEYNPTDGSLVSYEIPISYGNRDISIMKSSNGKFYCTVATGNEVQSIVEFDPVSHSIVLMKDVGAGTGSLLHSRSTLTEVSNFGLVGAAAGAPLFYPGGGIFKFDPSTKAYEELLYFPQGEGEYSLMPGILTFVPKSGQTISFAPISAKAPGDPNFTLVANASSGLPVTFSSSNSAVIEVSGNTAIVKSSGTCIITATQTGNATFSEVESSQTVTVTDPAKQTQTIIFDPLVDRTYGDQPFSLFVMSTSGLAVSVSSSNDEIASVSAANVVTIKKAGFVTLTAVQAGNATYQPAPDVQQLLRIKRHTQTISFGELPAKNLGDPAFQLTGVSDSKLPLTYTSSSTSVATVSNGMVTIVGAGSTRIMANQFGNENYLPAMEVDRILIVNSPGKQNQTISFEPLGTTKFGANNNIVNLSASASTGLPITFSSGDTDIATINGNVLTIKGVGTVLIGAEQSGNATYNPARAVQSLKVQKGDAIITFPEIGTKTLSQSGFDLSATSTSTAQIYYESSNSQIASIAGATVNLLRVGEVDIQAKQNANSFYNAAPPVTKRLVITSNQAPTVSQVFSEQTAFQLQPFEFIFAANVFTDPDGDPLTYSATLSSGDPLPAWLTFNNTSRTFSGTPSKTDRSVAIRVTAADPSGASVSQILSINIAVITGIETTSNSWFSIYPTPAQDIIHIATALRSDLRVRLLSFTGKELRVAADDDGKIDLNISDLSAGVYIMQIHSGEKNVFSRIIKK